MSIRPLFDSVAIKPLPAEQDTGSGLYMPQNLQEKPTRGVVVAVGEGRWNEAGTARVPMDVKVGDIVIYRDWGKSLFDVDGEQVLILAEKDVVAIVS